MGTMLPRGGPLDITSISTKHPRFRSRNVAYSYLVPSLSPDDTCTIKRLVLSLRRNLLFSVLHRITMQFKILQLQPMDESHPSGVVWRRLPSSPPIPSYYPLCKRRHVAEDRDTGAACGDPRATWIATDSGPVVS